MKGHTFKRCPCGSVYDAAGNRVNCPKKHGTWYYSHELPPDANGKRRQDRKGGFRTEKLAREAMNASIAKVTSGTWVDYPSISVAQYLDQWLASKVTLCSSTRRSYAEHIALYLRPGLGHLGLQELRDSHVDQLYAVMREIGQEVDESGETAERPAAPTAGCPALPGEGPRPQPRPAAAGARDADVRPQHRGQAQEAARQPGRARRGAHRTPPARRGVDGGARRALARHRRAPARRGLDAEQTGAFLDTAADNRLYPIYHLIAYRGLRRGEAAGVRWQDLSLAGRGLTIAQQIVQLGWATEIGAPKTDSGERVISLDLGTVDVLITWRERQASERHQAAGCWQDTGLVFTREDGTQLHPDLVTDTFHRIRKAAGLPPIRLHDLRHTAASLALQAGVPMKAVSEQLGHSSFAITADTYTSVLPDVAAAAAEAVAGIVPRKPAIPPATRSASEPGSGPGSDPARPRSQSVPTKGQMSPKEEDEMISDEVLPQVKHGGPRGARTHNKRNQDRCRATWLVASRHAS